MDCAGATEVCTGNYTCEPSNKGCFTQTYAPTVIEPNMLIARIVPEA